MPCQTFDNLCHLLSIVIQPNDAIDHDDTLSRWSSDQWEAVIALASRQLVLPSIAARLATDGTCAAMDPSLHAFFQEIHAGNIRRNGALLGQVDQICARANQLAIRPILLKGAAHLASNLYGDLGARYVSDIDILVDDDEQDR
ncbi:MAG: nucleotidyltransferase family protein, partial [Geminicoccaceae bacterium]